MKDNLKALGMTLCAVGGGVGSGYLITRLPIVVMIILLGVSIAGLFVILRAGLRCGI